MKSWLLRGLRMGIALVVTVGGLAALDEVAASDPLPLTCDVFDGGGLHVADNGDGTFDWTVRGSGVCTGGFPENYSVSFTGAGTSEGNGLCTQSLTSVALDVHAQFTNSAGTITRNLRWDIPVTPGVLAMPFVVSGDSLGAGVVSTRIFLKCSGTGGTDAARFIWEQTI